MINEYDTIKARIDLTDDIKAGTLGVVLSVYNNGTAFLIEFVDKDNKTIEDGMTVVRLKDVELVYKHKKE